MIAGYKTNVTIATDIQYLMVFLLLMQVVMNCIIFNLCYLVYAIRSIYIRLFGVVFYQCLWNWGVGGRGGAIRHCVVAMDAHIKFGR